MRLYIFAEMTVSLITYWPFLISKKIPLSPPQVVGINNVFMSLARGAATLSVPEGLRQGQILV
jgi:hypothetical protein